MPVAAQKIDKEYVLSDSSVNEYGFRLLTEGFQLASFQANPIGYYMHQRDNGVVLKWDNLRIVGDKVMGTPVINLSNERGQQTCDEVESGFLNAASVGHIIVLEYSTEPEMMLAGQTGPTVTKWYCKECSLVDIPGNCNALTQLYDEGENTINLADFTNQTLTIADIMKKVNLTITPDLLKYLNLSDAGDETQLNVAIANLSSRAAQAETLRTQNLALTTERDDYKTKLENLQASTVKKRVDDALDGASKEGKITNELKAQLAKDYATNPDGLEVMLKAMKPFKSIVDDLSSKAAKGQEDWSWADYEKNDPSGDLLQDLKASNEARYNELYNAKFKKKKK